MTQETELTLFVPSPELLVRLASGERPLGVRAGPPRIKILKETYFDTPDHALRRRGMTCKLRQVEGEDPDLVVTVGEGPDSEGITSRSRLTASAVGFGVFETLRGDSEAAHQIRKFVDPTRLHPQIALDIQRMGRVYRSFLVRRPILLLFFDRITVQAGNASAVFHELRIRRRRKGGPLIRDIAQQLRDHYHLFPDGLSTLQRAYRILAMEGRQADTGLSPYALTMALAVFREGRLGLQARGDLNIPTFRGSGEDAARALSADLLGTGELELVRLGSTEPREGRPMLEIWCAPDPTLPPEGPAARANLAWYPWHRLLEDVGRSGLRNPTLLSALLLLSRRRLLGRIDWVPRARDLGTEVQKPGGEEDVGVGGKGYLLDSELPEPELRALQALASGLPAVERPDAPLEARLRSASELSKGLHRFFLSEVSATKGRILSPADGGTGEDHLLLLDLLSIRIRGMMDRLYACYQEELLPQLEARHVHLRSWSGLMREDRRVLQELFQSRYLPEIHVAGEWEPSFIPEMPPEGCAVGITARIPGWDKTRFFHLVLGAETPSFLTVPGTTLVVSLEEVVRGFFFARFPELEEGETHTFRFMTSSVTVREPVGIVQTPTPSPAESEGDEAQAPVSFPVFNESRRSIVVRVVVRREMPEVYQAHLLRALERQVSRKNPLIGWSDLYPVAGPLELTGIDALLDLTQEKGSGRAPPRGPR